VKIGEEQVQVNDFFCADNAILRILTFPIIEGNSLNPLENPESIILGKEWSKRIFGNESPIGKVIDLSVGDDKYTLTVTALMDALPNNRTFIPGMIANINIALENLHKTINTSDTITRDAAYFRTSYDDWWFDSYLLLKEGANYKDLEKKIAASSAEYQPSKYYKHEIFLQPMKEFHFNSYKFTDFASDSLTTGKKSNIYIYSGVGLLILLIAISNYLILSLARSTSRRKEYGVRKVVGGRSIDLVRQTIRESMLFTLLAFPLAITLAEILLPYVNKLFMLNMKIGYLENLPFLFGMLLITILTGLFSSAYLAYIASKSNPIDILKPPASGRNSKIGLMKMLILLQLVIFIALLSSTFIVYGQIHYARTKSLGFNRENLLSVFINAHDGKDYYKPLKEELLKNPDIVGITGTMWTLPSNNKMDISNALYGKPETKINAEGLFVDYNFTDVLGMHLLMGESFNETMNPDEWMVIANKSFVDKMQLKDPVGTRLTWGKIVGVVDDFQLHSLHKPIAPILLFYHPTNFCNAVIVRARPGKSFEVVDFIKKRWATLVPEQPACISFFDDDLGNLYTEEKRFSIIVLLFTITSIFIAGIGLFGLAMFTIRGRTKEIGIRKVLGARNGSIVRLIVNEFLVLVLIASVVSVPITIWFMDKWLSRFAYHIPIKSAFFVFSTLIAMVIVLATLLLQTLKAANSNPVESLRYE